MILFLFVVFLCFEKNGSLVISNVLYFLLYDTIISNVGLIKYMPFYHIPTTGYIYLLGTIILPEAPQIHELGTHGTQLSNSHACDAMCKERPTDLSRGAALTRLTVAN